VHVVGVLGFLATHGVSIWATFRIRSERDPARVDHLIQLSSSTIPAFYASTGVLLTGGIVAAFLGHWWGQRWLWVSIGVLVATSVAMFLLARPYFRRVGFVARAMSEGSQAVTDEQFVSILRSGRPIQISVVGIAGLLLILFLMMYKPDLRFSTTPTVAAVTPQGAVPAGAESSLITLSASNTEFGARSVMAPSNAPFAIRFDNRDVGVAHNVAIYGDPGGTEPVFVGGTFAGPAARTYNIGPLAPGGYVFRCDVHPSMTGTLTVG
jgi:hypothetical protein